MRETQENQRAWVTSIFSANMIFWLTIKSPHFFITCKNTKEAYF